MPERPTVTENRLTDEHEIEPPVHRTDPTPDPITLTYFGAPPGEIYASEAALARLAKTRVWAMLCAIGMFIYSLIGGFFAIMWLGVVIFRHGQPGVGLTEFVILIPPNLVGAPLAFIGGALATRYYSAVGRTLARRNPDDRGGSLSSRALLPAA